MKTAMQELLEDIEKLMPDTYTRLVLKLELKTFYLEKEKEQIINAFNANHYSYWESDEQYYKETYK